MSHEEVTLKIAARELVSFVLRSGDLPPRRLGAPTSAIEGIRGHQRLQKARPEGYVPEVTVRYTHTHPRFNLQISGRIDGVFENKTPRVIEEIKTTRLEFGHISETARKLHLAQGKLYAWLYCQDHGLDKVKVRVTYLNVDNFTVSSDETPFSFAELDQFALDLIQVYLEWAETLRDWQLQCFASIEQLNFPFQSYRPGQRRFAAEVYRAIRDKTLLFAQAPTGIGKSAASLFPSLKAMGEGKCEKIFFLTAKTVGRTVAEEALAKMRNQGLALKAVTLTARDKICFNAPCDMETCEYARGYYDRLRPALKEIYTGQAFTREAILEAAERHTLCPFELSLDLAVWCDAIICDYNYAFDPGAHLRRFFSDDNQPNTLLIDEAHNLADRARSMYSAELFKSEVLSVKRDIAKIMPQASKKLASLNRVFLARKKAMDGAPQCTDTQVPEDLLRALSGFCRAADAWFAENRGVGAPDTLSDMYFKARRFLRTAELFGETHALIQRSEGKELEIKIYCRDPSPLLKTFLKKSSSAVFFSATLTPFPYFTRLLTGQETQATLGLPSPFPAENLCLVVAGGVSTLYRDRASSYIPILEIIDKIIHAKRGNYLVFFPSYKYLNEVHKRFVEHLPEMDTLAQKPGMTEDERHSFLESFQADRVTTLVGFAVMGGIFGEGVDLTGERLIGVIIVSVGLPGLCMERDLIRDYFNDKQEPGFAFAYQYPGMNRVLQTAGRVIRSEQDRGVVCLIDQRFGEPRYLNTFPPQWRPYFAMDSDQLASHVAGFWARGESPEESGP